MKKLLSLVLVLVMVLGLSVTAFAADPYLKINGVAVTAEGEVTGNAAITDGTVTYTAAKDGNPAKLTLNGATIVADDNNAEGIDTNSNLVIELIGENTITSNNQGIYSDGDVTFTGDGDLTVSSYGNAISPVNCTFSMSGTITVTTTGTDAYGIVAFGNIYVTSNGGKVIAHGPDETDGAILWYDDGVSGYKTAVGSADFDETNESKMTTVTADDDNFTVGGAVAKTVVLIAYPAPVSGSTTITATKEEPELAYTIVIPTATTLTESAHENVRLGGDNGVAGITVTTASAKTNVYYTVDLTNATLTDGTNTIATTYAYAQGGGYSALTGETKVTVYEGGTVKDSTIQVTADDTAWAAAPAGTYTASVVFNFGTEEVTPVTAADVFTTDAMYKLKLNLDIGLGGNRLYSFTYKKTIDGFEIVEILESDTNKTEEYKDNFSSTAAESSIIFNLGEMLTFTLNTSTNTYGFTGDIAESANFVSFSVKPAGATEFTEITLTVADPA